MARDARLRCESGGHVVLNCLQCMRFLVCHIIVRTNCTPRIGMMDDAWLNRAIR
jgi:hypothetical protein